MLAIEKNIALNISILSQRQQASCYPVKGLHINLPSYPISACIQYIFPPCDKSCISLGSMDLSTPSI